VSSACLELGDRDLPSVSSPAKWFLRSVCTLWIIDVNTLVMSFGSTDSRHKTSRSLAVRDEHNARQYSRCFMAP